MSMVVILTIIENLIAGGIVRISTLLGEARIKGPNSPAAGIGFIVGMLVALLFCYIFEVIFGLLDQSGKGFFGMISVLIGFLASDWLFKRFYRRSITRGQP